MISSENPADCASRGIDPQELDTHALWWNGPAWLAEPEDLWPHSTEIVVPEDELKKISVTTFLAVNDNFINEFLNKHSSFSALIRQTAICFKFIRKLKASIINKKSRSSFNSFILTADELTHAKQWWIRTIQRSTFIEEYNHLEKGVLISPRSKLRAFNVFMDSDALIRVGGRLFRKTPTHFTSQ